MTKKDFELIARAIRKQGDILAHDFGEPSAIVTTTANDLADALAADNPRFDRARFLAACGVSQ